MRNQWVWWLFDRSPERFQDWAESWARTLVVRRDRHRPIQRRATNYAAHVWYTATASTIPGAQITYAKEPPA